MVNIPRERWYDRRHRVDTGGADRHLDADQLEDSARYQATAPRVFRRILNALPVDPAEYVFVDLGSGKGRALIMAAGLGFREIIGVEVSERLHRIAERNIAEMQTARARETNALPRFNLARADAAAYSIPAGRTLVYLYNPFGPPTLAEVAKRVAKAASASGPEFFVVYYNPVHASILDDVREIVRFRSGRGYVVYCARR